MFRRHLDAIAERDVSTDCKCLGSNPHSRKLTLYLTVVTCLAKSGIDEVKKGLFEKFVESEAWEEIGVKLAAATEALFGGLISGLSKLELIKTIIWMAAATAATGIIYETTQLGESGGSAAVGKINIPADGFGTQPKNQDCDETATKNSESVSVTFLHPITI